MIVVFHVFFSPWLINHCFFSPQVIIKVEGLSTGYAEGLWWKTMLDLLANIGPALPGALWNFPSHGETVIRDDPTVFNIQLFIYIYITTTNPLDGLKTARVGLQNVSKCFQGSRSLSSWHDWWRCVVQKGDHVTWDFRTISQVCPRTMEK